MSGKPLTAKEMRKRKYRNKWHRAYTLVRNPIIVLERLQQELRDHADGDEEGEKPVREASSEIKF